MCHHCTQQMAALYRSMLSTKSSIRVLTVDPSLEPDPTDIWYKGLGTFGLNSCNGVYLMTHHFRPCWGLCFALIGQSWGGGCNWVSHLIHLSWGMPQAGCNRWVAQLHHHWGVWSNVVFKNVILYGLFVFLNEQGRLEPNKHNQNLLRPGLRRRQEVIILSVIHRFCLQPSSSTDSCPPLISPARLIAISFSTSRAICALELPFVLPQLSQQSPHMASTFFIH